MNWSGVEAEAVESACTITASRHHQRHSTTLAANLSDSAQHSMDCTIRVEFKVEAKGKRKLKLRRAAPRRAVSARAQSRVLSGATQHNVSV